MEENKELSDKQKKFLEVLFHEAEGKFLKAKRLAGYSENTTVKEVVDSLEVEISALTQKYINSGAVEAAFTLQNVLSSKKPIIGVKDKIKVAQDVLDRAGFKATDKVEVSGEGGLFILPAKDTSNDMDEDD